MEVTQPRLSYLEPNIVSAIQGMFPIGRFHCISKWFHVKRIKEVGNTMKIDSFDLHAIYLMFF